MNNQKKILYVITKSNFGGAGRYVFDLATESKKQGFEVKVACGGNGILTDKLKKEEIEVLPIPNLQRDINIFKEFLVLKSLRLIYKNESPDVVHLNSSKIGGIGALAARLEKVPKIIYTAHGWAFNEDRGVFWKLFTYVSSVATAMLSHIVITISYIEETQALSFPFVGVEKIRMIYNGIKYEAGREKESARSYIEETLNFKIPSNTTVIGTIGELHKNKGYIYALKMCKQLIERDRKFIYLIIGEGEERRTLEVFIRENNLNDHVKLLGAIPDPASGSTLLKAFDIFLLPSVKEGLPYVLLEAALAEVPIVATNVGGISEMILHEKSGLLATPKNEGALTIQIEKVLYDTHEQDRYRRNFKQVVESNFTLSAMLEKTIFEYLN